MQRRQVAMMPGTPNDAIRSSMAMVGGMEDAQRADATYQSSVDIVAMAGYRSDNLCETAKDEGVVGSGEKLPESGRCARDDGVDGL